MPRRFAVSLAVEQMTDAQLWTALHELVIMLDPLEMGYRPGQTHHLAVEARNVVLELRKRGTQLSLFPPAA